MKTSLTLRSGCSYSRARSHHMRITERVEDSGNILSGCNGAAIIASGRFELNDHELYAPVHGLITHEIPCVAQPPPFGRGISSVRPL